MRTRYPLAATLLAAAFVMFATLPVGAAPNPEAQTTVLSVKGMTCGGCAVSVKTALKKVDGVQDVKVSFKQRKAQVSYDPAKTSPKALAEAVTKAGYPATPDGVAGEKEPESEKDSDKESSRNR